MVDGKTVWEERETIGPSPDLVYRIRSVETVLLLGRA
jgi:hypothetical protein